MLSASSEGRLLVEDWEMSPVSMPKQPPVSRRVVPGPQGGVSPRVDSFRVV